MQEVVREILLDKIAFIARRDYEIIDAMRLVDLQNVP